ncbi:serine hydrolase domain-containing protein [Actinokineospora sp. NBRC 105648]|uniref:serine hydrolase domain-containing protein n=1 Tax=Actinokineospora sp. NBRC 105648 TaxID=3032206 RepID=UPI0024A2059D|nr:serine hydrolase domain-containing protein [Actinokineospora sp. NBRC 105648]GLZ43254.1 serine hydrolase [Actinokineospora sp. NBRC 105648]
MSGLSQAGLDRWRATMTAHVERGSVPGLVALVSRNGETHVHTAGLQEVGGVPMARDTIFRISSMTKPVTAVAAMILVEECRLRLDDPVDDLLPELADPQVLRSLDSPVDDTVPARGPITVRHLLNSTFGHGLIMAAPGTYPIQDALAELGLTPGPPAPASTPDADEWLRRLGSVPLLAHPGETWRYDTAYDVLGILVSRAAAQPFEEFLRERVFEPLGMVDTGFFVPAADLSRFATAYSGDSVFDPPAGQWSSAPAFFSGRGGLVSTVDDYFAFGRMMLDGGVLSRLSLRTMTMDQLNAGQKVGGELTPGFFKSFGWGFGVSVVTRQDAVDKVPGRFGWSGGFGTSSAMDPLCGMVSVLMSQRAWESPGGPDVYRDFLTTAYAAVE